MASKRQGTAVQVVRINDEEKFEIDHKALKAILCNQIIADLPVVVSVIVGEFRIGKSFMSNHFLHFLNTDNSSNWLSDEEARIPAFAWHNKSETCTLGIYLWSEPVIKRKSDGTQVAVLILDIQGTFDQKSSDKINAAVFSLSLLLSSNYTLYRIGNINMDCLNYFEFCLEYGCMAIESAGSKKPFQRLVFLVRDRELESENIGFKGGEAVLHEWFKQSPSEKLKRLDARIHQCFTDIRCFLMPHPGKEATQGSNERELNAWQLNCELENRYGKYDPEYAKHLNQFVSWLFSPENLAVKQVAGKMITCKELYTYFCTYVEIFNNFSDRFEVKSILEAHIQITNDEAIRRAMKLFNDFMNQHFGPAKPYARPEILKKRHAEIVQRCLKLYDDSAKMGDPQTIANFRQELKTNLDEKLEAYLVINNQKPKPGPLIKAVCGILFGVLLLLISPVFYFYVPVPHLFEIVLGLGGLVILVTILCTWCCSSWKTCDDFHSDLSNRCTFYKMCFCSRCCCKEEDEIPIASQFNV